MGKYILGVDGGSTKTHYVLFDVKGNLILFRKGGSLNYLAYPDRHKGAGRMLEKELDNLASVAGIRFSDIEYAVFGISGVDIKNDYELYSDYIKESGIDQFLLYNDAYIGIKAGCKKGYGICSVNGTGSCTALIDRNGECLQVGGLGYTFGGHGGSSSLVSLMIKSVYDCFFRCGPDTLMKNMLFDALDINNEYDLVEAVCKKVRKQKKVDKKTLAKIPFLAANKCDKTALGILRYLGREAAKSVLGGMAKLDFPEEESIDVVMAGSLFVRGENPALVDSFKENIKKGVKAKLNFTVLDVPPVTGSVVWALEKIMSPLKPEMRVKVIKQMRKHQ